MKSQEQLTEKLNTHLDRLKKKRQEQAELEKVKEELTVAKIELQKLAIENKMDKVEKEISHRELFDQELRSAISEAIEKRVSASYADLISSVDKLKKHLNIIDGVGNGEGPIIVVPGEIVGRYSTKNIIDIKEEKDDRNNGELQLTPGTGDNSSGQA